MSKDRIVESNDGELRTVRRLRDCIWLALEHPDQPGTPPERREQLERIHAALADLATLIRSDDPEGGA